MGYFDFFNDDRDELTDHELGGREEMLNRFLDDVGSHNQNASPVTIPEHALDVKLNEYGELIQKKDLDEKIKTLQKITASLDQHCITHPIGDIDLSGLKVDYKGTLNAAQLSAVLQTEGPLLVIAGAGSGKTRVIVHRVSYLLEREVAPQSILLLTFTRKAAKEMLDRVGVLLKDNRIQKVVGGTFHSFALRMLKQYANLLGIPFNFSIIDTSDSEDIIDLIRTELKYHQQVKKFPKKSRIYEVISYSRNRDKSLKEIILNDYSGLVDYIKDLELIYKGYTRYKRACRVFDYDDLLEVFRDALKQSQIFREKLGTRFKYIMVDEFQDTNLIQKEIIDLLSGMHKNIMVVGDDSQSIYAFRGANYENILRFPETYPKCKIIRIERNYRSNQPILDFTNQIMDHAHIAYPKRLYSKQKSKILPFIKRTFSQEDEAVFIVDQIADLMEKGIDAGQIAVLNRADWHNRYIQTELSRRNIPYVVVGGYKFIERKHIKDVIAYLRIIYNPYDAVSWHRILKYIAGVGKVTATGIVKSIQRNGENFSFDDYKSRKYYQELTALANMLREAKKPDYSLTQRIEIIKDYYAPIVKSREDDYQSRIQDVDVLIDLSKKYRELDTFLSDFVLDPPSNKIADQSERLIDEGEEKGKITISTVHSAKGLEWYAVFIPHALDGMFPSNRALDIEAMEEERRLFYVACSRAKEELYITFPRSVAAFDAFFHLPSRFLIEIDKGHYKLEG